MDSHYIITHCGTCPVSHGYRLLKANEAKKLWTAYLGVTTLLVLFFYGADFGQFAYINARLNADALIFAEDPTRKFSNGLAKLPGSVDIVWLGGCRDHDDLDVQTNACRCNRKKP